MKSIWRQMKAACLHWANQWLITACTHYAYTLCLSSRLIFLSVFLFKYQYIFLKDYFESTTVVTKMRLFNKCCSQKIAFLLPFIYLLLLLLFVGFNPVYTIKYTSIFLHLFTALLTEMCALNYSLATITDLNIESTLFTYVFVCDLPYLFYFIPLFFFINELVRTHTDNFPFRQLHFRLLLLLVFCSHCLKFNGESIVLHISMDKKKFSQSISELRRKAAFS